MIKKKVFLGKREDYNKKLKYLADLAQEEPWTFKSIAKQDPYRILRNYFQYTYDRLDEEEKIMPSADGKYSCINTGLLTRYDQEIIAVFSRSEQPGFIFSIPMTDWTKRKRSCHRQMGSILASIRGF